MDILLQWWLNKYNDLIKSIIDREIELQQHNNARYNISVKLDLKEVVLHQLDKGFTIGNIEKALLYKYGIDFADKILDTVKEGT